MNNDMHNFEQFMKQREKASLAFVNGDIGPLDRLSTHDSPASIFGPNGDTLDGADKVNASNANGASHFQSGGTNKFEVMQMGASDGIAYWAGIQRSTVRMQGKSEAIPMDLRVTEVFRLEDGEWRLVHRHADVLSPKAGK